MLSLVEEWPRSPDCEALDLQALHLIPNSKRLVPTPFVALLGCRTCGLVFTVLRPALGFACGAGTMLDVLRDAGWETLGIEVGRIAAFAAQRHRVIDALPEVPTFSRGDSYNRFHHTFRHPGAQTCARLTLYHLWIA